jgi:hypothetical protein
MNTNLPLDGFPARHTTDQCERSLIVRSTSLVSKSLAVNVSTVVSSTHRAIGGAANAKASMTRSPLFPNDYIAADVLKRIIFASGNRSLSPHPPNRQNRFCPAQTAGCGNALSIANDRDQLPQCAISTALKPHELSSLIITKPSTTFSMRWRRTTSHLGERGMLLEASTGRSI